MCVLLERNIHALCRVPNNVQEMTPKQIIHHFWEGSDTHNSQKDASKRDHLSNCRPRPARQWWCQRQACNSEDKLGAVVGKAAAPNRSQSQDSEPSSSTPMLIAPCILWGRRKMSSPNPCPARSDQRSDMQTKQKQEPYLSFLTAGPHRENRSSFTHHENWSSSTNEPLNIRSSATTSILSLSFLHRTALRTM